MKHTILLLFFLCTTHNILLSQNEDSSVVENSIKLSDNAEISVITCGPGSEVYSAFGHSAFRVRDPKIGLDKVYNYGTFNFDTPNFYGKFAQGNLLYQLSAYDFGKFVKTYYREARWVKAQVLDFSSDEVQASFDFLENNALPANRDYLYDYFYDNCSTRLYDVIDAIVSDKLIIPETFNNLNETHRTLIQPYLTYQPWGDFGIDIALGSVIDRQISMQEFLFLPENVFSFFEELKITTNDGNLKPIVKRTEVILRGPKLDIHISLLTPFILFTIIGLFIVFRTRKDIRSKQRSRWLDFSLFFSFGLVGVLLALISFATSHKSAAYNFNLLWAFAPNLLFSFVLLKRTLPSWIKKYALLLLLALACLLFIWILKIQIFSNGVIPIIVFLAVRYFYLWKYAK